MAMTTERIEINPAIMMGKPVIRGTVAYGAASVAHEEVVLLPDAPNPGKS